MTAKSKSDNPEGSVVEVDQGMGEAQKAAQAMLYLEQQRKRKLERCNEEIQAVLQRHGAQLSAFVYVSQDGRILADVQIQLIPNQATPLNL